MARTEDKPRSPLIGHEFRFFRHEFHVLQSARDIDDGTLRIDYSAPPRASVSRHVHRFQEEHFEVVSGTLGVRVGGRELILSPGQSAVGPAGVPHSWWNPADEEVRFLAGISPGLEVEIWLETLLGLARDGKTVRGLPRNPLQFAVLAREVGSWVYLGPMGKALFAPVSALAYVGGLLGYKTRYPRYSGPGAGCKEGGAMAAPPKSPLQRA